MMDADIPNIPNGVDDERHVNFFLNPLLFLGIFKLLSNVDQHLSLAPGILRHHVGKFNHFDAVKEIRA